jgi:acyl-CoA thioester hydrolase
MTKMISEPHRFSLRVYYEDTDAGGIVYYANYLRFFERGRTEMLRSMGIGHQDLKVQHGLIFAVRSCSIDYQAPARLDDVLEVVTEICALGASRLDMQQFIRHEEKILTTARITVVAIGDDGRAKRIPSALRQIIIPLLAPAGAA